MDLSGPLVEVRVLEVGGGIAASFCTRLLAQYGAEVIKIEPPGTGDPLRHQGPFVQHQPHPETSLPFLYLNTNKQSLTLDLTTNRGAQIFIDLVAEADLVVEASKPGTLESWGLGWETLRAVNPRLILTSISAFGQTGPYRDYEATEVVLAALGGIMYMSGLSTKEPITHGHPQSQFMGGVHAFGSALAAHFHVLRGGPGQQVDVSMQASVAHQHVHTIGLYTYSGATHGRAPRAGGAGHNGSGNGFGGIVQMEDGFLSPFSPPKWDDLADFLDLPELKDDRFRTEPDRKVHAAELDAIIIPALTKVKRYDFFHHAQSNGWSTGVVQTMEDILACSQLEAREFWTELEHPVAGTLRYPAEFCRMSDSPGKLIEPAPLLGQYNRAILGGRLGYSDAQQEALRTQGVI